MVNGVDFKSIIDANSLINNIIKENNEFNICTPKVSFDDFSNGKWYIVLGKSQPGKLRVADNSGIIKIVDESYFMKQKIKKETKKEPM